MALGRAVKRVMMVIVVVAAGGFAAMHSGAVKAFYEDIYPSDPGKRQALDLCFMQDHKFNRLEASERNACYRHMLFPVGAASSDGAPQHPDANLVDLTRAASQGRMPRNDIRRFEQTQDAIHTPH